MRKRTCGVLAAAGFALGAFLLISQVGVVNLYLNDGGTLGTIPEWSFNSAGAGTALAFGTTHPGLVAEGIKEALVTTAAGLVVAVPAQLFYNALMSKVVKIEGDIEEVGNFLLEAREDRAFAEARD